MSYGLLLPQTATIKTISDGSLDADRNWTRTSSTATVPCRLEMLATSEPNDHGIGVEDRWRIFLPLGTALRAADELVVGQRRYQVVGTPEQVYGQRSPHHVEALLLYVGDDEQSPSN